MQGLLAVVLVICVLVCSAAVKAPDNRWLGVLGAIAAVVGVVSLLMAAQGEDAVRRRTAAAKVLKGISELQEIEAAAQQLAAQLEQLSLQPSWQLVSAIAAKQHHTRLQALQALLELP